MGVGDTSGMESDASSRWQDLFERHSRVLEEHRQFLSSLQAESHRATSSADLIGECLAQTEMMTKKVKDSAEKLMSTNSSDSGAVPRPSVNGVRSKKRIPTGPRIDPSGFFMTDTTPTPVPGLSSHLPTSAVIRTKRKAPESDEDPVKSPPLATEQQERPLKKVRVRGVPMTDDGAATKSSEPEIAQKDATDEHIEIPAAGDSFAQEVEERLRKKELKRLKKQEKKRKRESGVSDVPMPDVQQESENSHLNTEKPQKKRRRGLDGTADGTDVLSQATSRSGQSTPPVVKGRKKRSSPAAEYIESILHSTGGSK